LKGSRRPSSLASTPYASHVEGMNCIQPSAPADDTFRLRPYAVSISLIAARISHGTPYRRPAAW
jgi:hypothetical protein